MSLKLGEEIGEVHNTIDQLFRFGKGTGTVAIGGFKQKVADGVAVIVPAGAKHNVIKLQNLQNSNCTRFIQRQNT